MKRHVVLTVGSISGFLSVALGAFGAHGLKDMLIAHGRLDTFELAVEYQFYHSLALLATGLLMTTHASRWLSRAGWCFLGGILFFSGSLYMLAILNLPVLGAVTPVGGLLFLGGWVLMAIAVAKSQKQ